MTKIISFIWLISSFSSFADTYTEKIQPIFDGRCISCHSCYNAPCQLNLQNYEGFDRGATKQILYDGTRIDSVNPTRMGIDAQTTKEWREKKFFSLNNSPDADKNLFYRIIALKNPNLMTLPVTSVEDSNHCPENPEEYRIFADGNTSMAMPFAFPAIEKEKKEVLEAWIQAGAPGPSTEAQAHILRILPSTDKQLKAWDKFLNQKTNEQKLVSRYLYEHLFLAHVHFDQDPRSFFRLVRSRTQCELGIVELATRRPNDRPGVDEFHYCFKKLTGTIVSKTHLPFHLTSQKMARFKELFFSEKWKVTTLPSYEAKITENPFLAFKDIPVKARYQFLLDDSQYELSTFIKGPVCNGSAAVNSIQEQFYVAFLRPSSDPMLDSAFQEKAIGELILPGVWGSDIKLLKTAGHLSSLVGKRESYRRLKVDWIRKNKAQGYGFSDLWDGDGHNQNAMLTVFRHDDNAVVRTGAHGDLPKTLFFLDYALMERLVYNLVVNFDVFGNVGHQFLTRAYMDFIRMEAEENFLMFLPIEQRIPLRKDWYQGYFTEKKLKYFFPTLGLDIPSAVKYRDPASAKREFLERFMFDYLKPQVLGERDSLNWKRIHDENPLKLNKIEKSLSELASVKAEDLTPFARFFPDLAYVLIDEEVYTIIHQREHYNISWIFDEEDRFKPQEDSLTIKKGIWGSYPNMIFKASSIHVNDFVQEVWGIKDKKGYAKLVERFGVPRLNPEFWKVYDKVNELYFKAEPIDSGYIDLTRYEMR